MVTREFLNSHAGAVDSESACSLDLSFDRSGALEGARVGAPLTRSDIGTSARVNPGKDIEVLSCPKCKGSITFIRGRMGKLGQPIYRGSQVNITCKQWSCPACRVLLRRKLNQRAFEGKMFEEAKRLFESGVKYATKMLTLTVPGESYRKTHTIMEAVDDLWRNWRKLYNSMRQKYGEFYFFGVLEFQRDGYPHLHVILVGESIKEKGVRAYIEKKWRGTYGMGFMRINARRRIFDKETRSYRFIEVQNPKNMFSYLLDYLGSDLPPVDVKFRHMFSASSGALRQKEKSSTDEFIVWGQVSGWSIQDYVPGVKGDFMELFLVRGKQALLSELEKLSNRDPDAKTFRCAAPRQAELRALYQELLP